MRTIPDRKEGLYFGEELADDDPRVLAGTPLHGRNLFSSHVPELRVAVLSWFEELARVGHAVMRGIALGLGLPGGWFNEHVTTHPTLLFRIFRYPMDGPGNWGVAEHTDYGLLTLLMQDDCGGLQVKGRDGWVDAPPLAESFVCNIGDMLERMTGGRYRSTPHRVLNTSGASRLSFPFFFDPAWDAEILPTPGAASAASDRWDGADVPPFEGTYGEYLLAKVEKVFPILKERVLDERSD